MHLVSVHVVTALEQLRFSIVPCFVHFGEAYKRRLSHCLGYWQPIGWSEPSFFNEGATLPKKYTEHCRNGYFTGWLLTHVKLRVKFLRNFTMFLQLEIKSHHLLGGKNGTKLFTSHLLALSFHFLLFCIQICYFSSFLFQHGKRLTNVLHFPRAFPTSQEAKTLTGMLDVLKPKISFHFFCRSRSSLMFYKP